MHTNKENEISGIVAIWMADAKDCIDKSEVPPTLVEVAIDKCPEVSSRIIFEHGGVLPPWGRCQYGVSPWSGSGGDRGHFEKMLEKAMESRDCKREVLNQPVPWGVEDEGLQAELSKEARERFEKYRNRLGEKGVFFEIPDFPEFPEVTCREDMVIKPAPHMSDAMHYAMRHYFTRPDFQVTDSVYAYRNDIKTARPSQFRERRILVKAQRAAWKNRKLGL